MEILCCTAKYRRLFRFPESLPEPAAPPTSALGPWYANTLNVGRLRLLHYTSQPSRLAVVVPRSSAKTAEQRFTAALAQLLEHLNIPAQVIAAECATHFPLVHARATDRSVLGTMNDQAFAVRTDLAYGLAATPLELMTRLAETPCRPLGPDFPERVAEQRLQAATHRS
jgi:hypothetical protein